MKMHYISLKFGLSKCSRMSKFNSEKPETRFNTSKLNNRMVYDLGQYGEQSAAITKYIIPNSFH